MRAGHLFGVEPPVVAGGEFKGQFIILIIIFSHINVKSITADIVIGSAGNFLLFPSAFSADVTAFCQLLFYLSQIFLVEGDIQSSRNGFQMIDLCPDFLCQGGKRFKSTFHFAVFIEIPFCVLRGSHCGIQRNHHRFIGIIVQGFQGGRAGLGTITVGIQQFSVDTVRFFLFRILYLTQL